MRVFVVYEVSFDTRKRSYSSGRSRLSKRDNELEKGAFPGNTLLMKYTISK